MAFKRNPQCSNPDCRKGAFGTTVEIEEGAHPNQKAKWYCTRCNSVSLTGKVWTCSCSECGQKVVRDRSGSLNKLKNQRYATACGACYKKLVLDVAPPPPKPEVIYSRSERCMLCDQPLKFKCGCAAEFRILQVAA